METNLPNKKAAQRKREIERTFERMVRAAKENDVSVILIAGDLFDTAAVTAMTVDFVLDTVRQCPTIDFLYLRGNHDKNPLSLSARTLPDNLKLFGDTWTTYSYPDADITGIEWTDDNAAKMYDSLALDPGRTNIVVMHGMTGTLPGRETVCLPKLRQKGIDYLALGHLHSYQKEFIDGRGSYCYSGCLEGRGFDECGEKGYVLLETTDGGIRSTFTPFAQRTLEEIRVDVTGLEKFTQIRAAAAEALSTCPQESLVKLVLTGKTTLTAQLDVGFLENCFTGDFYFIKIKDETVLAADPTDFAGDISLKGVFIRSVLNDQTLTEEERKAIITAGLQALAGEEIAL